MAGLDTIFAISGAGVILAIVTISIIAIIREGSRGRYLDHTQQATRDLIDQLALDNQRLREQLNMQNQVADTSPMELPVNVLARMMDNYLSAAEIRTASFEFDADWDNLPGDTKRAKINSLIELAIKEQRLGELLNIVRGISPRQDWPSV